MGNENIFHFITVASMRMKSMHAIINEMEEMQFVHCSPWNLQKILAICKF